MGCYLVLLRSYSLFYVCRIFFFYFFTNFLLMISAILSLFKGLISIECDLFKSVELNRVIGFRVTWTFLVLGGITEKIR